MASLHRSLGEQLLFENHSCFCLQIGNVFSHANTYSFHFLCYSFRDAQMVT